MIDRITSAMPLISAVRNQRRANPMFSGAFEHWAALSFGTFLFAVEKKSTLAKDKRSVTKHRHIGMKPVMCSCAGCG